ncbi:MAG: hypothetical protein FVQ82_11800 [Planctomycetes bacterium]|nr:hypothetical protein [Planctomycetota bacterium]
MVDTFYEIERAGGVYGALRRVAPVSREGLGDYVKVFLGIDVPDVSHCGGHCSPMDYLWHCYSSDFSFGKSSSNGDCVVWANRGGSKTVLGAVATLLDCIFKPQCQVRILGGSLEQSSRMYEYLGKFLGGSFDGMLDGSMLKEKCGFVNGSSAQILTQSAKSVRGVHVHKLRCDEIELFNKEVFDAAKFTTRSSDNIKASMEIISTMHRPYGLMQKLVDEAIKNETPIFKWCMLEVIEQCRGRSCSRCALDVYCRGKAKNAGGYMKIDDCITQMRRSSKAGFESEMLCRRPNLENAVFSDFDTKIHIAPVEYDSSLPLYRAMDFGFVNPFVCLWIQVDGEGRVRVIDEYFRRRATIEIHAKELMERTPCGEESVTASFCDPAGASVNDVSGTSAVRELRAMGIRTIYCNSRILDGVERLRRIVRAGDGSSRLLISPKCVRLIEAMECYHYPEIGERELPEKDGVYDHPIDALRYFLVNVDKNVKPERKRY